MKTVDARGLSCPEPVLLTMNEIKNNEKEIEVLVDAYVCVENVSRCGKNSGYTVSVEQNGNEYKLKLKK